MHQNLRAVTVNRESVLCVGAGRGIAEVGKRRDGIARLEIGLAVQILGLDKGDVLVLARCANEYVSGDALMVEDFDKVANAQVLPGAALPVWSGSRTVANTVVVIFGFGSAAGGRSNGLLEGFGCDRVRKRLTGLGKPIFADPGGQSADKSFALRLHCVAIHIVSTSTIEDMDFRMVDDPIRLMAFDVLICILDRSHADNNGQGKNGQARRDRSKLGDELENDDEGEKSTRER